MQPLIKPRGRQCLSREPSRLLSQYTHVRKWPYSWRVLLHRTAGRSRSPDPAIMIPSPGSRRPPHASTQDHEKAALSCLARAKPGNKAAAAVPFSRRFADGPVVTTRPRSGVLVLEQGKEAHFECSAAGNPTPTVFWRKQVRC